MQDSTLWQIEGSMRRTSGAHLNEDKPIISVEELIRREREAVVLGYEVGFDVGKSAILLKVRLHTKQDRCFLIPTMMITQLCDAIERGRELSGWSVSYQNRRPTIHEWDWQEKGHSRVARAICAPTNNGALVGILLGNGQTKVLTLAPPHALDIARWIRDGLARGDLIDIAEDKVSPPN